MLWGKLRSKQLPSDIHSFLVAWVEETVIF